MSGKFIRTSLIISIVVIASVNAAEKEKVRDVREVRFGENAICFVEGEKAICRSIEFTHKESGEKIRGVEISDEQTTVQITDEGKLAIYNDTIGDDKKQGHVVVKDLSGGITFDSEKHEHDLLSLDEEGGYGKIELKLGSNITFGSCLDTSQDTTVTYDKLKEFINKEGAIYFLLSSVWNSSKVAGVATHDYGDAREGSEEILLHIKGKEIELLDKFLKSDRGGKEKLLGKSSISEFTELLVNLHEHGLTEEYSLTKESCCNYNHFGYAMQLLVKKVNDSLKQAINQDVSRWSTEMKWFREIKGWSPEKQRRIENILRRVISPASNGTRISVVHDNGMEETIDVEKVKILYNATNIQSVHFDSNPTVVITYNDGTTDEVRHNDTAATETEVRHNDGSRRRGVMSSEDYDRDIVFIELKSEELILIHLLTNLNPSDTDDLTAYYPLWQSLSSELKDKLHKSYLPKKVTMFLESIHEREIQTLSSQLKRLMTYAVGKVEIP